jgi:integrase
MARHILMEAKCGPMEPPKFADFVREVYLPWAKANKRSYDRGDASLSKPLLAFFGEYRLDQIRPLMIEDYKRKRVETPTIHGKTRAAASINRELEMLSKIFSMAIDNDLTVKNPCRRVRKLRMNNKRYRYLSVDEEARLMIALDEGPPHLKPLVILAIQTGMRRGELFNLQWSNVDFGRGVIIVTDTKRGDGKDRQIPISSVARGVLLRLGESRVSDNVFPVSEAKKSWMSALKRADISDFRFHDLRHTAATRWADSGADAFTIASLLGHSNIQMSARYTHALDENRRRFIEAAAQYAWRKEAGESNILQFAVPQ